MTQKIVDLAQRRGLANAKGAKPPPGRNCASCAFWREPDPEVRALIDAEREQVYDDLRKALQDEEALDRARAIVGETPVLSTCHYVFEMRRDLVEQVRKFNEEGPAWAGDFFNLRRLAPETSPEDNTKCPQWRGKEI